MSIIIFSKPIHSGKTTELMHWCKMQKSCLGILMPDVDGVRKMYDIEEQFYFDAEYKRQSSVNEDLLVIGKYSFYQSAFNKANRIVEKSILLNPSFIVIDEIGMLEINRTGFYTSVKQLINALNARTINSKVVLTVRDILVADIVKYFHILDYKIISSLIEL